MTQKLSPEADIAKHLPYVYSSIKGMYRNSCNVTRVFNVIFTSMALVDPFDRPDKFSINFNTARHYRP